MRRTFALIIAVGLMAALLALPGTVLGRAAFTEYTATETQIDGPNFDPATDWTKPIVQTTFQSVFVDDATDPRAGGTTHVSGKIMIETGVLATMLAVLGAVADAPPPKFSGGGYWEVMRDEMAGYFEVRVNGPQRKHFRLFCVLERHGSDVGLGGPAVIVIEGMVKPFRAEFKATDYRRVRRLGEECRKRAPRSVA